MAIDDMDRIRFVETGRQPNRLVGFDPKTRSFFGHTDIESGGGTVRHMVFDRKTGVIRFGTDNGTIGRAQVSGIKAAMQCDAPVETGVSTQRREGRPESNNAAALSEPLRR